MLGDTAEKTKNPLKKAMRRRNARTVQFNPQPTYRDASDYEYSSDEEDGEEQGLMNGGEVQAAEQSAVTETADDDTTLAETHTNATKREIEETNGNVEMNGRVDEVESRRGPAEQPRPSEESLVDKQRNCKHISTWRRQKLTLFSWSWQVTPWYCQKHRFLFPRRNGRDSENHPYS